MNCIAIVDKKWGIGKNNRLLFNIPEDMEFFKQKTVGNIVVMGKNTLLSFPGENPLPNRTNIILSTTLERNDCIVCRNLFALWKQLCKFNLQDVFIIGGEQVYRQLLPYCSKAYITKVNADGYASDFFPNLDKDRNWELILSGENQMFGDVEFCFCEYINEAVNTIQEK